jgi:glycosyltransferase involved in cell wall biosynthesis
MIQGNNKTYILFHYSFHNLAGTERVLSNLIEMISKMGGRLILLLASNEQKLAIDLSHYPVEIHYLNCVSPNVGSQLRLLSSHTNILKKAKLFLQKENLNENLIIISTSALLSAVAYLAVKPSNRTSTNFIACEHFSLHIVGKFSKLVRKRFYRYMSVVTLTEGDRAIVQKHYKPKASICIPNASPFPIDTSHFSGDHKIILAIGRFTEQKGFDLLVNAFARIAHKHADWKLRIVGDDFGTKALVEQMIADRGLTNVEIQPATSDVQKVYQSGSLFVLSSRFEGLPMVLIEAISHGLPIVAFNCPTGPKEIVNESNGILVENGNIIALAEGMEKLIENKALLLTKSRGAAKTAELYTKSKIEKLWQELL